MKFSKSFITKEKDKLVLQFNYFKDDTDKGGFTISVIRQDHIIFSCQIQDTKLDPFEFDDEEKVLEGVILIFNQFKELLKNETES